MEKQENKSKWDDLAREIGAEISPDILEREEAASTRSESDVAAAKSMESQVTEHAAPPKRAATDWNSLVTGLGLPPLPPAPEPEPEPKPAPPQRAAAREEPRRERPAEREGRQPRRERPQRQDSRRERGRGRGRDEETRSRREDREPREVEDESRPRRSERESREGEEESRERPERGGRGRRGRSGPRRLPRERDARGERAGREQHGERAGREERDEQIDIEIEESVTREEPRKWNDTRETRVSRPEEESVRAEERVEERPEPVREEPLKSAAISLWHKIFGTPAEQEAKLTEERVDEPETVASLDIRDEPTDAGGFVDVHADERPADDFSVEAQRDEAGEVVSEEDTDERRRGRSRRRRGRGRGRGSESAESGSADDESARRRNRGSESNDRRRRRRDDDVEVEEPLDDHTAEGGAGEDDDEELVAAGESRRSALQRAIPSWEDAIGFIVDANMQNRSQRKPARSGPRENGGGNGGGGGGRGRSRGRRRPQQHD